MLRVFPPAELPAKTPSPQSHHLQIPISRGFHGDFMGCHPMFSRGFWQDPMISHGIPKGTMISKDFDSQRVKLSVFQVQNLP
jgi:hypothetical protein